MSGCRDLTGKLEVKKKGMIGTDNDWRNSKNTCGKKENKEVSKKTQKKGSEINERKKKRIKQTKIL